MNAIFTETSRPRVEAKHCGLESRRLRARAIQAAGHGASGPGLASLSSPGAEDWRTVDTDNPRGQEMAPGASGKNWRGKCESRDGACCGCYLCVFCNIGTRVIGCWMCLCEDCYCFYDLLSFQYWS